jgi:hypothetical protein
MPSRPPRPGLRAPYYSRRDSPANCCVLGSGYEVPFLSLRPWPNRLVRRPEPVPFSPGFNRYGTVADKARGGFCRPAIGALRRAEPGLAGQTRRATPSTGRTGRTPSPASPPRAAAAPRHTVPGDRPAGRPACSRGRWPRPGPARAAARGRRLARPAITCHAARDSRSSGRHPCPVPGGRGLRAACLPADASNSCGSRATLSVLKRPIKGLT